MQGKEILLSKAVEKQNKKKSAANIARIAHPYKEKVICVNKWGVL